MISIKEAKEISIAKWTRELDDNSEDYFTASDKMKYFSKKYPDLITHHSCGFCLRHGFNWNAHGTDKCCQNCELASTEAKACILDGSLYSFIEESEENNFQIELAIKQLIQIIKDIPDEE